MPCQYQVYSDQPFRCKLVCVLLPLCSQSCFSFAVPQWLKFSFFLLKSSIDVFFCNWMSWVSDLRHESWHDATNQSWLMQRLNIVAGTRLYTGRRKQPSHEKKVFEVSELFNTNYCTKCLKLDIWDLRKSAIALFVK